MLLPMTTGNKFHTSLLPWDFRVLGLGGGSVGCFKNFFVLFMFEDFCYLLRIVPK